MERKTRSTATGTMSGHYRADVHSVVVRITKKQDIALIAAQRWRISTMIKSAIQKFRKAQINGDTYTPFTFMQDFPNVETAIIEIRDSTSKRIISLTMNGQYLVNTPIQYIVGDISEIHIRAAVNESGKEEATEYTLFVKPCRGFSYD